MAAPAHFADLRSAQDLTQAQLDQMIGNEHTLLPDTPAPDTGAPYTISACWPAPGPAFFEPMISRMAGRMPGVRTVEKLRTEFLCPAGETLARTGTRLPLDAPYPDGHPLARRD